MKVLLTLVVAAVAAFAGRRWAEARDTRAPAAPSEDLAPLRARAAELRAENARLAEALASRTGGLVAASAPSDDGLADADIAAALERWRAAHPVDEMQAREAKARAGTPVGELDLAALPMAEVAHLLADKGLNNLRRQELFQQLRDLGRIDEYVAQMEKLAEADPKNADLQVALGNAYLQKLFGMSGASPEMGELAYKSDACFDRALEIDDNNWAARFTKAVSLSNWPAFLGRGPEAIDEFETLLDQQSTQPSRPEFALTYLFLGNMQQAAGQRDKALATWKSGFALFPESEELQHAIELAGKQ